MIFCHLTSLTEGQKEPSATYFSFYMLSSSEAEGKSPHTLVSFPITLNNAQPLPVTILEYSPAATTGPVSPSFPGFSSFLPDSKETDYLACC